MLHHHSPSQPTTAGGPRLRGNHSEKQTKSDSPGGSSNASGGSSNSTKTTSTSTTFIDVNSDPEVTISNYEFTSSTSTTTPIVSTNNPPIVANTLFLRVVCCACSFREWCNMRRGKHVIATVGLVFFGLLVIVYYQVVLGCNILMPVVVVAVGTFLIEDHVLDIKKNPSSLLKFRIGFVLVFFMVGAIIKAGLGTESLKMIGITITSLALYTAWCLAVDYDIERRTNQHATIDPPARMNYHQFTGQRTPIGWVISCNAIAWLSVALFGFWLGAYGSPIFVLSLCATLVCIASGELCHVHFSRCEQTEEIYYKLLSCLVYFLVIPLTRAVALFDNIINNSDSATDSKSQDADKNAEAVVESDYVVLTSFVILAFVYAKLIWYDNKRVSGQSPYTATSIGDDQMV